MYLAVAAAAATAAGATAGCEERCGNGRLDRGELCDWCDWRDSDCDDGSRAGFPTRFGYWSRCEDTCTSLSYDGLIGRTIDEAAVVLVRDSSASMCVGYAPAAEMVASLVDELSRRSARFAATTADGRANVWAAATATWPACAPGLGPPAGCVWEGDPGDYGGFSGFSWVGPAGGLSTNKTAEQFVRIAGCIADVGAEGEPLEWPLGTLVEYLEGELFPCTVSPCWGNEGPLVFPGAEIPLVTVILTDEDDCSACAGDTCGPGSATSSTECAIDPGVTSTLVSVAEIRARLEGFTEGPVSLIVAAGPPSAATIPDPVDPDRIAPSCVAPDGRSAAPANRLADLVAELGDNATFLSWCDVTPESLVDAVAAHLPGPRFTTTVPAEALPTLRIHLDPRQGQPCPSYAFATPAGLCAIEPADEPDSGYLLRPVVRPDGSVEYRVDTAYPGPWTPGDESRWDLVCDWIGTEPTLLGVVGD